MVLVDGIALNHVGCDDWEDGHLEHSGACSAVEAGNAGGGQAHGTHFKFVLGTGVVHIVLCQRGEAGGGAGIAHGEVRLLEVGGGCLLGQVHRDNHTGIAGGGTGNRHGGCGGQLHLSASHQQIACADGHVLATVAHGTAGQNAVCQQALEHPAVVFGGDHLVVKVNAVNLRTHRVPPLIRSVRVVASSPLL